MSITVSIPDDVANEIYWLLDELAFGRLSEKASDWLDNNYRNQVQRVWDKSAMQRTALTCGHAVDLLDKLDNKCLACGKPQRSKERRGVSQ